MLKFVLASALSGFIIIVSGIALSLLIGDESKALASKFSFEMSGGQRFAFHIGLRLASGVALTVLISMLSTASGDILPFLAVITAAWFIAYVPGFLMLADLSVLKLSTAGVIMMWGWLEFALAGYCAHRVLS